MRVLITGHSGFVGSAALMCLLERHHEVTALARPGGGAPRPNGTDEPPFRTIHADLRDTARLRELARQHDAVVHCAASDDPEFHSVSLHAALAMMDGLGSEGRFVCHGGTLVFGETGPEASAPLAFNSPPFLKARADHDKAIIERGGVVAFASCIYGGAAAVIPNLLKDAATQLSAAVYPGDGSAIWSVVHVMDLGRLLADVIAIERQDAAPLFASSDAVSVKRMAQSIGQSRSLPVRPATESETQTAFGAFADALAMHQHFEGRPAREAYGWTPLVDFPAQFAPETYSRSQVAEN